MNEVIVIGAGQAGLSMSYWLKKRDVSHLVLESNARIGDNWRKRWDSLSLFSPAAYNNLPGMPFPAPAGSLPTKDQAADYLEAYASRFKLPVQTDTQIESLEAIEGGFRLKTSQGELDARNVVVATGPFNTPRIPVFAKDIPAHIDQLHTSEYHNPAQLPEVPTLVVGAGASGSQIARELSANRKVYLAGRDPGTLPRKILGMDIYWWLYKTGIITTRWNSWMGRLMRKNANKGDAHVGQKLKPMARKAGIMLMCKLAAAEQNDLVFADGKRLDDVRSIVWATGYRQNFDWIRLPVFDENGMPRHQRGVVSEAPGLYFIGLKTLYRLNSSLMGGVGRDAEYLAGQI
jgi:putative flavoprotein involved in K+ transport